MLQEFKDFAMRGNVVDMAVGIIIGAAFSTIVKSLVDDVIMPPIGLLLGGVDFSNFFVTLKAGAETVGPYGSLEAAKAAGAVTLNYGQFVNHVISFLIVAWAVFMLIKAMNNLQRKKEEEPVTKAPTTRDCPECLSTIHVKARRCPQCTSEIAAV